MQKQLMNTFFLTFCNNFVALADWIRSGYVGGQFVITRNILSISVLHHRDYNQLIVRKSAAKLEYNYWEIG